MFKNIVIVAVIVLSSQLSMFYLWQQRDIHQDKMSLEYEEMRQAAVRTCQQIAATTNNKAWGYKECVKEMTGTGQKKASLL